jgi:pyruvate dehydrogenase E2 component (dihydrolipoamide acetyltransferase)
VKWLKKEGDKVKSGEVIAEIETDKATMEMEAFEGGVISKITAPEGTKVAVGQPIAVISSGKEAPAAPTAAPAPTVKQEPKPQPAKPVEVQRVEAKQASAAPVAINTAEIREPDESRAHGPTREFISTDPPKREQIDDGRVRVSPLARKIARESGVDLSTIKGSGPGGRIVKKDVMDAAPTAKPQAEESRALQPAAPAVATTVAQHRVAAGSSEIVPLSKIRQVIAQRLQQSKQTIPHFYETVDIDVEELTKLRARLNQQLEHQRIKLSLGDLIAKGIAAALLEHPDVNAHFNGKEIIRFGDVNLGMAVALPDGLIVPVLRGVNHMNLREIRVRSADLVERARAQRLKQEEMSGATFTVSNLGMFGVREFSAIINPPEVAILAVGGAEKRAVVRGEQIVARHMMTVTLSCDHRAVDGASAAEFLTTLRQLLEEPGLMLV